MIPRIPVGPSYFETDTPRRSAILGWAPVPVTVMGRVCGESASNEPSVTTRETSKSSAKSNRSAVNLFQRIDGSTPVTITRSRFMEGITKPKT